MIVTQNISDEHRDRKKNKKRLKFVRDAATGELDAGKWKIIGKQPSKSKAQTGTVDQYLIRFEKESEHSFQESLILSNSFEYTKTVLDAYLALFAGVEKKIVWQSASPEFIQAIEANFDGEGTPFSEWLNDWFAECMISARAPVIVSYPESYDAPAAVILPRDNMRNWYCQKGDFQFLTYDSEHVTVKGIAVECKPSIWAMTSDTIGEYDPANNNAPFVSESTKNPSDNQLGRVPAVDLWVFNGRSILSPLASLDMNLMNLDREMRKVIRNQAGMNFLVVDEKVDLTRMSEKTLIKNPRDAANNKPFWANYAAGSLGDAFQYEDRRIKIIFDISRLRKQKDDVAESGLAKTIDFTQTKAVLNHVARAMESAFPKIADLMAAFEGNNVSATLQISKDFDTSTADAEIDRLLKELSSGFGPTFDAHQKKVYRDKYSKLPPDLRKKSDAEIDNYEKNRQEAVI